MPDRTADLVAQTTDRLAERLRELNRTPAFGSTGDGYDQTTRLLADAMSEEGLHPDVVAVPRDLLEREWGSDLERTRDYIPVSRFADRSIVLARIPGSDPAAPSIHFTQHYDLPGFYAPAGAWPADDGAHWLSSPGANQCRSGVFAMLVAGSVIAASGESRGDVFVSFTPDNHLGGETGAGYLVAQGLGRSPYVITGAASGPLGLVLGYKGAAWLRVTVTGRAGLASQPHLAVNAIDKMRGVQERLAALADRLPARVSAFAVRPEAMRVPTLTAAKIGSTGIAIPDTCVLYLDRRSIPEETLAEALAEIQQALAEARAADPDLQVELEMVHAVESASVAADERLPAVLADSITTVLGRKPEAFVLPYYTEHRLFAEGWGAQVVGYGPGRSDATPDDDRLALEDVSRAAQVLVRTASSVAERVA